MATSSQSLRMIELQLLRHGKSDWPEGVIDHDRPLSERGARDAARMGQYLRENSGLPDIVISSTALRARTTAEIFMTAAELSRTELIVVEQLYVTTHQKLLAEMALYERHEIVMAVGHNPVFENALISLATHDLSLTENGKLMTTANLARIHLESGKIEITRPRDIEASFNMP